MLVCPLCRIVLAKGEAVCPRDGQTPLSREPHPIPPAVAARFTIVEPFADGDSGTLYLADDKQTGRRGLLKLLRGATAWTVSERSRLKRELVKQATLTHPALVPPLATGEADSLIWLFREWIDGVSLSVRLARSGALTVPEALAVAAQVAGALDDLHRAGLLMRDLSPSHVLVQAQPSGVPKIALIDAGIAMRIPGAGEVTGKPGYVSPEHVSGKLVSFRSDLYSLGCVIHEMLTGTPVFRGTTEHVLEAQRSQSAPQIGVSLPSGVAALIGQLLLKEPRDRPFSAQQVRRTLEPFLPQDATSTKREATAEFAIGEHLATPSAKGSGTLRPPTRKQTLVGIALPKPTADRTQELTSLDLAQAERVLANRAEPTQELTPLDLAQAERVLAKSADRTQELTPLDLARAEQVLGASRAETSRSGAPPPFRRDADPTTPLTPADLRIARPTPRSAPPPAPGAKSPRPKSTPPLPYAIRPVAPGNAAVRTAVGMPAPEPLPAPIVAKAPPPKTPEPKTPEVKAPEPKNGAAVLPTAEAAPTAVDATPPPAETPEAPAAIEPAPQAEEPAVPEAPEPRDSYEALGGDDDAPEDDAPVPTIELPIAASPEPSSASSSASVSALTTGELAAVPGLRQRPTPYLVIVAFCVIAGATGLLGSYLFSSSETEPTTVSAPAAPPPTPVAVAPAAATPTSAAPSAPAAPPPTPPAVVEAPAPEPPPEAAEAAPSEPVAVAPEPEPEPAAAAPEPAPAAAPEPTPPPARTSEPEARSSRRDRRRSRGGSSHAEAPAARPVIASSVGSSSTASSGGGDFDQLRNEARAAFQARRYADAARAYERASRIRPRDASVWSGLGAARMQSGNTAGAVQAYRQAISIEPRNARYHVALGRALAAAGDRARARQSFEQALRIDPRNADARAQLARL
ncbi:serine/threonine-protein kinase [Sandaracinus amylolyticus]|uniref:serine/threonine-protein kinase n=1 Tax=Sandaracinus amylolyticus TaxID=927083 RepID=UPI001F1BE7A7|nr:serine/threonine-protein kinase [Sandaracinus amylolyticus]UJR84245.1 Hypothetical protein I5071_63220 [Sandaracinus amylolyticus]